MEEVVKISKDDLEVEIINFGAIVKSIKFKGVDVTLGYDTVEEYIKSKEYYGATIGRVCNRIGNARFSLNGKTYLLDVNDGENCLHGGTKGFNKVLWNHRESGDKHIFSYRSKDNEEGFPGNIDVNVSFYIRNNGLVIEYIAESDADTVCNLTNHCFFNLNGTGSGDILSHVLQIDSDKILENDEKLIPTGRLIDIRNTAYDFNQATEIGKRINDGNIQMKYAGGYDNAYVIKTEGYRRVATLIGDKTGIQLDVITDQPSIQFYSGNFLNGETGKGGKPNVYRGSVCLETQGYPNAVNRPSFPSVILKKGERYHTKTVYGFKQTEKPN